LRSIPPVIKSEIIRKYLEGFSTTEISNICGVSVGSVSSIITEESNKNNDYLQIREVTKIFKQNNLKISDVAYAIRLHNKVKNLGLDTLFFENFLDSTDTVSFRLKSEHSKFLEDIKRIVQFEMASQIKINDLYAYMIKAKLEYADLKNKINKMIKENRELASQNEKMKKENRELYSKHEIDKYQIEEYIRQKPSFLSYKRNIATHKTFPQWMLNEILLEEASKKIGIQIDPETLYNKLRFIYNFPHKHTNLIKKIMAIETDLFKLDNF
jgi:regulator of replication initiation timing